MQMIKDKYGRMFRTLRVSLLNHCNMGCVYCVTDEDELREQNTGVGGQALTGGQQALTGGQQALTGGQQAGGAKPALSLSDLLTIIDRLHGQLGLDTVRLTGGEPLLYPGLVELIGGIRSIGIPRIKLTTNGFLLERSAGRMKAAGLESINVSLDAIDEEVFRRMSRRHSVQRIVRGIDAALDAGLDVKINTVVMKGMNDSQIVPLLEFALTRNCRIRFLEVMAMGHLHAQPGQYLMSQDEILKVIGGQYMLEPLERAESATARYWRTDAGHCFGIIANESEPFCQDCNRLRLDSSGNIYGCLSSNQPIPLDLAESREEWGVKLQEALSQKQALRFIGSELSMLQIGG
jgi:GTP 3',8-cyclase